MWKFIKHYALEIYSVTAMLLLVCAAMMGELSVVQKFVCVFTFLYILHEWEEDRYPGGFVNLIAQMIQVEVPDSTKRASRIPAGIFLLFYSIVPFVFHQCTFVVMMMAVFGCFEGWVHMMGVRLFHLKRFYTPGMVTAILELIASVALITYLAVNDMGEWYDYALSPFAYFVTYMMLQKTMTVLVGIKYSDMPKLLKQQIRKGKN